MLQHATRDLGQFIDAELRSRLSTSALALNGPAVAIDTRACAALAPVLHEIAASGIGISDPGTRDQAAISWTCDESGGCVIRCKLAGGYGRFRHAERTATCPSSDAETINFDVCDGCVRIAVPAQFIALGGNAAASATPSPLQGQTVLVVEDQLIIALDLEMILQQQGASRVRIVGTVDEALSLISTNAPDVAVLDVNLGNSTSFPVAQELLRLGVPFIFATGYGKEADFPNELQLVPLVGKPYCPKAICDAIAATKAM